jgi:hypothetical protein
MSKVAPNLLDLVGVIVDLPEYNLLGLTSFYLI